MRTDFIYIDDASQIDTSKTTVYDLNKRYIDSRGNLYGLKYDRQQRKVVVVRLLRTTSDRADTIRSRMVENRRNAKIQSSAKEKLSQENEVTNEGEDDLLEEDTLEMSAEAYVPEGEDAVAEILEENDTQNQEPFIPDSFVLALFDAIKLHKERFVTVISNISKAQIISHQDRQNHNDFEDLKRTLDIEAYKKYEEICNIQKELQEYPRPVSYYITRLSRPAQRTLQSIQSEKTKIRFILLCEINDYFREIYKIFLTVIDRFQEMVARVGNFEEKMKVTQRKQFLQDAQITLNNTRKDVQDVLTKLRTLEEYLNDPSHFRS